MRDKATLIILFLVFSVVFAATAAEAQTRKNKVTKANTARKKAAFQKERRKQVEAWMIEGKYQHDGSAELAYIGTIESVPALLKVLNDHPGYDSNARWSGGMLPPDGFDRNGEDIPDRQPVKPPKPKRMVYICTYIHAADALRKITGQKFSEYEDWVAWWEHYDKAQVKEK